ncbi:MAG: hypothetical protein HOM11_06005 [Methylococcales bacterium]|jgi:hypothetical protein|nr:hypothetical protein [Methylococcales bacterium]
MTKVDDMTADELESVLRENDAYNVTLAAGDTVDETVKRLFAKRITGELSREEYLASAHLLMD